MAHFIQLNLEAKTPRQNSGADQRKAPGPKAGSIERTAFFSGLLLVTLFSGALLLGANGCSKGTSKSAAVTPTNQNPSTQGAAVVSPTPNPTPAMPAESKPAKKKPAKKKSSTVTYTNPDYGVSFRYPRSYILKTGDEPQVDLAGLGPVQTDFVQPGGVTLAALELPRNPYPGADVSSAFFSVSVHPDLTPAECEQFAFPDPDGPDNGPIATSKVKVGALEFDEMEDSMKQADAKYYHVFENGTCYEFGLGLGTAGDKAKEGVAQVNSEEVFSKLEKILSTVKIRSAAVPEKAVPEVAAGAPSAPADGSKD